MTHPDYPEHAKLANVADKSQKIGEFLDWLDSEHDAEIMVWNDAVAEYRPIGKRQIELLAEFFEIDLKKIEAEKRAMLDAMRAMNDGG